MLNHSFIFIVALFMVIRSAAYSTKYAIRLAKDFALSDYVVGFIIVAVISILPETFIAISALLGGIPSFGLGALLGSNIADLTLVFALLVWISRREITVQSKIIKNNQAFPFILALPIVLGIDGHFSRIEGLALLMIGVIFYYLAFKSGVDKTHTEKEPNRLKNSLFLLLSIAVLVIGSYFTVDSAKALASILEINPILIAILVVGIGTTIPELFFSLKSIEKKDDPLALGDILGTVLADATVVIGAMALISPFAFPGRIIYVTGSFMVLAAALLLHFLKTGRKLTDKEASFLFLFWIIFAMVEFFLNK